MLYLDQIISLTGLRRVGKRTIMLKIVDDYLKSGFEPNRIFYFSFDEYKNVRIKDILKEYSNLFKLNLRKGKYVFYLMKYKN